MIELSLSEFYKGGFVDEGYELYVLRDSNEVILYIGISRDSVWHRWFGGFSSHMRPLADGTLRGNSLVGEAIERRLPVSWNWKIELWTKADCIQNLIREGISEIDERDVRTVGIVEIEAHLIQRASPAYNVMHAGGRHEDPLLKEQLDGAYNKIFKSDSK